MKGLQWGEKGGATAFFLNDIFAALLQRMTRSIFHDLVCDNLEAVLPFYKITILNIYHLKAEWENNPHPNTNKFGFGCSCRISNNK